MARLRNVWISHGQTSVRLHRQCEAQSWPSWIWVLLTVLFLADVSGLAVMDVVLDGASYKDMGGIILFAIALMVMSHLRPLPPRIYVFGTGTAVAIFAWPLLRLANHLSMRTTLPWTDSLLAGWDVDIGFDWLAYVTWIDHHDLIFATMNRVYDDLTLYSGIIFILLLAFRGAQRAQEFILLFLATAVTSIVIGLFFPAKAPMAFFLPDADQFNHLTASTGTGHVKYLLALRYEPMPHISFSHMPGLVTFPSFHTAMGIVAIYCARGELKLFVPVTPINLLMIASTPVFGTHYLVDLIGGAFICLVCIVAYRLSVRRIRDAASSEAALEIG